MDLYSGQKQPEATAPASPEPNGPELPEISQLDQTFSKPKSLGKEADALRVHIEWRQLKNRTVNDPAVQMAKAYAQAARTDLEKRERLSAYYEVYYQRMSALATTPEIKLALQVLRASHQYLLSSAASATFTYTRGRHTNANALGLARTYKAAAQTQKEISCVVFVGILPARVRYSIPTRTFFVARSSSG